MRYLSRRAVKLGLVCCLLQFVACDGEQQPSPEVTDEVHRIEQQTVPPGGRLVQNLVTTLGTTALHADWQVEISSTDQQYFDWLKQGLGDGYHVVSQNQSVLTMGKTLPGDSYTLEFKNNLGSMISVHFVAQGD